MLVPLSKYLEESLESPWISITIVENDPSQLAAAMSLFDFEKFVQTCKKQNINLVLHVDSNAPALKDRLYAQFSNDNPTVLYGWQLFRSPVLSPALMQIHSWLHAPEGAAQPALAVVGFATDEINQTQQALWNALSQKRMKILSSSALQSSDPVVLVASGPSLNEHIEWISHNRQGLNLVASGSSLGVLLKANIKPDAVVFLERGSIVYSDLCDILAEGYSLEGITSIVSSTIDPRVPALFDSAVFFHRPVSAATCLFPHDEQAVLPVAGPHVVNAAFEVLLTLGCRNILLIGADFAAKNRSVPRAVNALGESPRTLNIPVTGNKGKTVFSEPELLYTASLIERVIKTTPDCQIFRLGEGASLALVSDISDAESYVDRFTSSPNVLKNALNNLPYSSFSTDACSQFFDNVNLDLINWVKNINSTATNSHSWSRSLVDTVTPALKRIYSSHTQEQFFISRILCQPLFYSAMSLHDASFNDSRHYDEVNSSFIVSTELMQSVVQQWLSVMNSWLNISQLPIWNLVVAFPIYKSFQKLVLLFKLFIHYFCIEFISSAYELQFW